MRKLRRFAGGRLLPCVLLALFFVLALAVLSIWLPRLLAPIACLERLFALVVALIVAGSDELAEYKISKLVLIVLLPWTGSALCLLWRCRPAKTPERTVPSFGEGVMQRVATLCAQSSLIPSHAERAEYFPVGREMYLRLLDDLSAAQRSIWLEYYIIANGVFFSDVLRVLGEKASAGLDVRLIYDDFGCSLTLPRNFAKTLRRFGVKTCVFRKIRFPSRAMGRRDHRKIAVIDGEIAYTGGVNLADEYIGEIIRFGHWKDTAVRIAGAPAAQFAALFARTWNSISPADNLSSPPPKTGGDIPCAVFADSADEGGRVGVQILTLLLGAAEKSVYCFTPYLAPGSALLQALKTAAASGTDVRLMIPHIPDKRIPFLLTKSYARELLRAGVKIRAYTAGFLHAKNLVADRRYAVVSTYNLDFRSLHLQAECGALVEDGEISAALERDFLSAWEDGTEIAPAGTVERVLGRILRLFAPLI